MSNREMPVTEAVTITDEEEFVSYELAYHVLPTVTEGEVNTVRDKIVSNIEELGGSIGLEETPKRIELAYEIVKHIEGKNRRFTSAYFGWVRFVSTPESVISIAEKVTSDNQVLRHLLIRLNKTEELNPFYYHEAMVANDKKILDVDEEANETDIDPNKNTEDDVSDTADIADDAGVESIGTDLEQEDATKKIVTDDFEENIQKSTEESDKSTKSNI